MWQNPTHQISYISMTLKLLPGIVAQFILGWRNGNFCSTASQVPCYNKDMQCSMWQGDMSLHRHGRLTIQGSHNFSPEAKNALSLDKLFSYQSHCHMKTKKRYGCIDIYSGRHLTWSKLTAGFLNFEACGGSRDTAASNLNDDRICLTTCH